eukprot:GHVQ01015948.1.p1 GENE.GHVQ01015948.1~~GHVQ01015948.1.p1  ORF type:complete len:945 (-),score=190.06 GHVQ01015948.1:718-3264(-)
MDGVDNGKVSSVDGEGYNYSSDDHHTFTCIDAVDRNNSNSDRTILCNSTAHTRNNDTVDDCISMETEKNSLNDINYKVDLLSSVESSHCSMLVSSDVSSSKTSAEPNNGEPTPIAPRPADPWTSVPQRQNSAGTDEVFTEDTVRRRLDGRSGEEEDSRKGYSDAVGGDEWSSADDDAVESTQGCMRGYMYVNRQLSNASGGGRSKTSDNGYADDFELFSPPSITQHNHAPSDIDRRDTSSGITDSPVRSGNPTVNNQTNCSFVPGLALTEVPPYCTSLSVDTPEPSSPQSHPGPSTSPPPITAVSRATEAETNGDELDCCSGDEFPVSLTQSRRGNHDTEGHVYTDDEASLASSSGSVMIGGSIEKGSDVDAVGDSCVDESRADSRCASEDGSVVGHEEFTQDRQQEGDAVVVVPEGDGNAGQQTASYSNAQGGDIELSDIYDNAVPLESPTVDHQLNSSFVSSLLLTEVPPYSISLSVDTPEPSLPQSPPGLSTSPPPITPQSHTIKPPTPGDQQNCCSDDPCPADDNGVESMQRCVRDYNYVNRQLSNVSGGNRSKASDNCYVDDFELFSQPSITHHNHAASDVDRGDTASSGITDSPVPPENPTVDHQSNCSFVPRIVLTGVPPYCNSFSVDSPEPSQSQSRPGLSTSPPPITPLCDATEALNNGDQPNCCSDEFEDIGDSCVDESCTDSKCTSEHGSVVGHDELTVDTTNLLTPGDPSNCSSDDKKPPFSPTPSPGGNHFTEGRVYTEDEASVASGAVNIDGSVDRGSELDDVCDNRCGSEDGFVLGHGEFIQVRRDDDEAVLVVPESERHPGEEVASDSEGMYDEAVATESDCSDYSDEWMTE